ncbi:MAG: acyloxyacyl hydrolase [Syntrophales bacterium]|nr:acyloxyacyl hydrolase [Syntrophales bacterium]
MNPRHFIRPILLSLLILFPNLVYGTEVDSEKTSIEDRFLTESALITGIGTSEISEGHYRPILLIWHLGVDLKKYFPKMKAWEGSFSAHLEPQLNPVISPETDFEFGIGLGVQYTHPLTDKLSIYISGSVGPHYISVVTIEQADGFLFSDAIGAGLYFFITKNSALNLGYRLRHLSNAGFEQPNWGINTHFAIIGYTVFF